MSQPPTFAQLLKRYRVRARLSQEELAERAGLSARAISDLERGPGRAPRNATVRLLAEALGLSQEEQTAFEMAARGEAMRTQPLPAPSHNPPLQRTATSHNLPFQLTPFIGREREVEEVRGMLLRPDVRLLTLTGLGGTGKTRLALRTGEELTGEFPEGVRFVSLAAITEPELVISEIGQAVGVQETSSREPVEGLEQHLRDRRMLLVLDNLEQVLPAAPLVGRLLSACPGLRVLATSRVSLRLYGEYTYRVPPLGLPGGGDAEAALDSEAVRLFLNRARAARVGFELTDANATAVSEICRRLDGLPLALELAAARVRLFTPEALLARLSSRLGMLTGGARDLPERHRTLRAALDWSYDLLDVGERQLLAELSVFAGGFGLGAAEAVCGRESEFDALEGVSSLLDKSLLRPEEGTGGEPRFGLLETVREYARERLEEDGKAEAVRRRHASYYLKLAEAAEPELQGPNQVWWLDRLEAEHDNLRAALTWSTARGEAGLALALSGALWRFWYAHSHLTEGRGWLARALAIGGELSPAARAKALHGAGALAEFQSDYELGAALQEESLSLRTGTRDGAVAESLYELAGIAQERGDIARARALYGESLALCRELGDRPGLAVVLYRLGIMAIREGDPGRAEDLAGEALALYRELGDTAGAAAASNVLGMAARDRDDLDRARTLLAEGMALYREVGNKHGVSWSLSELGIVALREGDSRSALELFERRLELSRELGDRKGIAHGLMDLGDAALALGDHDRASAAYAESLGLLRELGDRAGAARCLQGLGRVYRVAGIPRPASAELSTALAWCAAEGIPGSILEEGEQKPPPGLPIPGTGEILSAREAEVLRLLATGASNRGIAAELDIGEQTVKTHVSHILHKLDATSRAQAAARARELGLL